MSKFIVKNCHHLMNSFYADGREAHNECGNSSTDEKCCVVKDCFLKKVAEKLINVVNSNLCSSCDGCGYDAGCADKECGTHAAHECLDLMGIEFVEGDED